MPESDVDSIDTYSAVMGMAVAMLVSAMAYGVAPVAESGGKAVTWTHFALIGAALLAIGFVLMHINNE